MNQPPVQPGLISAAIKAPQTSGGVGAGIDLAATPASEARGLEDELERRLTVAEAELAYARCELERFARGVAHDLRTPLWTISGFIGLLAEDYGESLPPPARRYLELVQRGSNDMAQMLDGLLLLSQAESVPLARRMVQPADLAQRALASLDEAGPPPIDMNIGQLPQCSADPAMLEQVFSILLVNALKFTRGRDPPRIDVGYETTPAGRASGGAYFVCDNGTGFDPRHAGELFDIFRRLHAVEEFEGAGVGLAIAQRLVRRHGGEMWADGRPGHGATFFFTLEAGP